MDKIKKITIITLIVLFFSLLSIYMIHEVYLDISTGTAKFCAKGLVCNEHKLETSPITYYVALVLHAFFAFAAMYMAIWLINAYLKRNNSSNNTLKRDAKNHRAP